MRFIEDNGVDEYEHEHFWNAEKRICVTYTPRM